MSLFSPDAIWTTPNFAQLLTKQWDDEVFVFNPASSETHLLNEGAFALLNALHAQPASTRELLASYLPADQADLHDAFVAQIEQLALVGLICPQAN